MRNGEIHYLATKAISLLAVPVSIYFISTGMTPIEQGYYYAMLSLIQIQILGDFGFNVVLSQYISHEWGSIQENKDGAKDRLSSLIKIALVWGSIIPVFTALLVAVGGFFYFNKVEGAQVEWLAPWLLLTITIAISMFGSTLRVVAEGCYKIREVQIVSLITLCFGSAALCLSLYFGLKLYSLVISQAFQGILLVVILAYRNIEILKLSKMKELSSKIYWGKDFIHQQIKIGISWISGYLMYQSFVPILMITAGADSAGKFGLLLQAYNFTHSISMVWLNNVQPYFGGYWASGNVNKIKKLTKQIVTKSIITACIFVVMAILFIFLLKLYYPSIGNRFSEISVCIIMLSVVVLKQEQAVYTSVIRYSKIEPFLYPTLIVSLLVVMSNILFSRNSVLMVTILYFILNGIILTKITKYIYNNKIKRYGLL